jgi:DNA-directed RNA polymerase subunit N (RpoN/RPB10)
MIIPIRCFTCQKPVGHKWDEYNKLKEKIGEEKALDSLGYSRYCCRRMFITHIDIVDTLLKYDNTK